MLFTKRRLVQLNEVEIHTTQLLKPVLELIYMLFLHLM
jgi:hypothetical protein